MQEKKEVGLINYVKAGWLSQSGEHPPTDPAILVLVSRWLVFFASGRKMRNLDFTNTSEKERDKNWILKKWILHSLG